MQAFQGDMVAKADSVTGPSAWVSFPVQISLGFWCGLLVCTVDAAEIT